MNFNGDGEDKLTQEDLTKVMRNNPQLKDMSDADLYKLLVMDLGRVAIDTVRTECKEQKLEVDETFILSEAIRLTNELSPLDFHKDFKKDVKSIIRGMGKK